MKAKNFGLKENSGAKNLALILIASILLEDCLLKITDLVAVAFTIYETVGINNEIC